MCSEVESVRSGIWPGPDYGEYEEKCKMVIKSEIAIVRRVRRDVFGVVSSVALVEVLVVPTLDELSSLAFYPMVKLIRSTYDEPNANIAAVRLT